MKVKNISKTIITAITCCVLMGYSSFSGAADMSYGKITGGGEYIQVGSTIFSLTVNALTTKDAVVKGSIQYTRDDLVFHAPVTCYRIFVASDGNWAAVIIGPAKIQEGSAAIENPWVAVCVKEHETGHGEVIRVPWPLTQDQAEAYCGQNYTGSYPATVVEGNFIIRPPE